MILLLKDDTVDIVEKTAYLRILLQTCKSQHTFVCMMYYVCTDDACYFICTYLVDKKTLTQSYIPSLLLFDLHYVLTLN